MDYSVINGLLQNASILIAFAILYGFFKIKNYNEKHLLNQFGVGVIIGVFGIFLISTPWVTVPGITFDTRSVLLSVSGLFFGPVPTIIAMLETGAFRISIGGDGLYMGLAVITTSGATGLLWRKFRPNWEKGNYHLELISMGVVVHVLMILCAFLLPSEVIFKTIKTIAFPVVVIYPLITLLLGAIIQYQLKAWKVKQELDLSEERFKFATEGVGDGVWDWNVQTNEVYYSKLWKKILGYNDSEIGNSFDEWEKLVHPNDIKLALVSLNNHLEGLTPEYKNEHRLLCKDKTYKWILARGKVIEHDENGKPLRVIGTHTDISERIKTQETILLNEERFRLISSVTSDYMFESKITEEGKPEMVWEFGAFENITGYKPEEFISIGGFRSTIHPDDVQIDIKDFENLQRNQKVISELRTITKTGNIVWISVYANPIWDNENQKLKGIYGAVQDITERKNIENALILSEEKFRKAFITSPDSINLTRISDGTYLDINKGFEKIIGYKPEELIGKTSTELNIWKKPSDREKLIETLEEKGFVENLEAEFVSKNGRIISGLMSACIIELNNEKAILSITRDITERKKIEKEIKKLNEELEEKVKDRTNELEIKISEIQRMNRLFVGRELRIKELKEKIKEMENSLKDTTKN
ncbi:MAG TPA: PAS domain S-box protein [Draconibacterium sp.]|nr:PAS domain S-box protein [Draconibacterium sp.]